MKKHWPMWVAFLSILTLAIVGVIYGVATHEEPGFTNPDYRWEHAPLSVACSGYTPADEDACDVASEAVSRVNSRLGFSMLVWSTDDAADITVTMRAPVEVGAAERDQPGGHYELAGTAGHYQHCDVQTMNASGGASDLELLVVYHELGHCLGLAHDDYSQSIMYPTQEATPDRTIPSWISDSDRALLRAKYESR